MARAVCLRFRRLVSWAGWSLRGSGHRLRRRSATYQVQASGGGLATRARAGVRSTGRRRGVGDHGGGAGGVIRFLGPGLGATHAGRQLALGAVCHAHRVALGGGGLGGRRSGPGLGPRSTACGSLPQRGWWCPWWLERRGSLSVFCGEPGPLPMGAYSRRPAVVGSLVGCPSFACGSVERIISVW